MHPVGPNPSVLLRPPPTHDVGFLADVVLVAAQRADRPRGPDFDEDALADVVRRRDRCARSHRRGLEHGTTYVIEIDGERAGRLRVVRPPDSGELAGIQLLPAHQGHGLGTHLIEQFLVDAHQAGLPARAARAARQPPGPRPLRTPRLRGGRRARTAPTTARRRGPEGVAR